MIGWAVAGTGAIARRFAADIALSGASRIRAVASQDAERARGLAGAIGPDVAHGDLAAILTRTEIDAVYVAGTPETHARIAIAALAAGKPVLVEKPFATSAAEAREIAAAARAAGRLAMEAMWMRFTPGIRRMRAFREDGVVGTPVRLEASLSFRNPGSRDDPLFDLGVYPVSLALHLLGPSASVTALRSPNGVSLLACHGDAVLSANVGLDAEGPNRAVLVGDAGTIATDAPFFCPSYLTLRRAPAPLPATKAAPGAALPKAARTNAWRQALRPLRDRRIPTPFRGTGLQYQIDHFAALLASGASESPVMPLDDSVATLALLERAAQAAGDAAKVERGR